MVIAVLGDEEKKKEFLSRPFPEKTEFVFADTLKSLSMIEADYYFYLNDILDPEQISHLNILSGKPLIANSVTFTTLQYSIPVIRINGWNSLLSRPVVEVALAKNASFKASDFFSPLGWEVEVVPDISGMVVPRIVSMIINEAYFTLESGVSSREEIDVAMRLGTNYPFGPFEWSRKIGLKNVISLLMELSRRDSRYTPCPLLLKEAEASVDTKLM